MAPEEAAVEVRFSLKFFGFSFFLRLSFYSFSFAHESFLLNSTTRSKQVLAAAGAAGAGGAGGADEGRKG